MRSYRLEGMSRGLWALMAALLVSALVFTSAQAMRLAPMVTELTTTGAGSTARIEVGNVGSRAMPFETSITKIAMDQDGNVTETPADENFLVFPPQGVVAVSGRQVVRVQWVGAALDKSEAYYLSVRQLPVPTDPRTIPGTETAISVNVLYTMKALMIVSPTGATPNVRVVSAVPVAVAPPQPEVDPGVDLETAPVATTPGVRVEVANIGSRHAMMSGATWNIVGTTVQGEAFSRRLSGSEVSQMVGVGYVPAGDGRRVFDLPLGVELDGSKPITVRFTQ